MGDHVTIYIMPIYISGLYIYMYIYIMPIYIYEYIYILCLYIYYAYIYILCQYICIHIYIYIYIYHAYIYMYIYYACIYVYIKKHIYMNIYKCICIWMYINMYTVTWSTTERREIRNFPCPFVFELTGRQRLTVKKRNRNVGQFLAVEATNPGQNESQQMFALCDRMKEIVDQTNRLTEETG